MHGDNYAQMSDEELVSESLQDQKAYYTLMKRYEEKLARYVFRISSSTKEDAEDIIQEAFIRAYQNLNDFDSGLKFSSWIYRITHNQVVSHWRKSQSRPQTAQTDDDLLQWIVSDEDLTKDLARKLDRETIKSVLQNLDAKYREVLVLKFLEQKSYEEMSDILQKPVGTIGTLVSRAKQQFRTIANEQSVEFETTI